jgi:hypothetical protein
MIAPFEKLQRLGGNRIIQVIVSRSCNIFTCSSCTQLLPYRRDALNMSVDVFRDAVRSLKDWPGVVALFGGNPVSHPRFADLCHILIEEIHDQGRRGLWTNDLLNDDNGVVAKATFWPHGVHNLNTHGVASAAERFQKWLPGFTVLGTTQPSWHSPVMMNWRDLGMTEAEWVAARERCDVNRNWSGAIAEQQGEARGFFCEIAAALDGIRGEAHGVPAVAGWWRQGMAAFSDQVTQCCDRGCGIPLKFKGHLDKDEVYDCTASFVPLMNTPKARLVTPVVHVQAPERTREATDYQRIRSTER